MTQLNRTRKGLLFLFVLLLALLPMLTAEAALRRGSKGEEVSAVQRRLKQWGYYDGAVDGVYGAATERAVRLFQKKNGLDADGLAGEETLRVLYSEEAKASGND